MCLANFSSCRVSIEPHHDSGHDRESDSEESRQKQKAPLWSFPQRHPSSLNGIFHIRSSLKGSTSVRPTHSPVKAWDWRFSLMQGRGHAIEIDRQVFRNS